MSDAPEYPYPEDGGRTHYWGCFRERGHHNCAVAEVARLEAEVARLRGELEWEKAVTEAALDRHDYIAARFKVLKAKNARLLSDAPERWDAALVDRLMDVAMVLATAPLHMDAEAGEAMSRDADEAAQEITALRERVARLEDGLRDILTLNHDQDSGKARRMAAIAHRALNRDTTDE